MTSPDASLLGQVHIAVIRLDEKLDNVRSEMRHMQDTHKDGHSDHEARLRALETRPYVAPATVWKLVAALTGLASVIIALVNIMK